MAWKLFLKSCNLLINNLPDALRISAPLIVVAVLTALTTPTTDIEAFETMSEDQIFETIFTPSLYAFSFAYIVAFLWVAVAWHRFVLLQERPSGLMPRMMPGAMLGYLGRLILLSLVLILVMIPCMFAVGVVGLILGGSQVVLFLLTLGLTAIGMIVFYRLALILPAGAVGRKLTFGESWNATRGHSSVIFGVAFISALLSNALALPMQAPGPDWINTIYNFVITWISTMIGVSLMTTLYGHFVEARPID